MNKKREELEKEYAEVTAELEQEQHKSQRLENCQRRFKIVGKRRRNFVVFRRGV